MLVAMKFRHFARFKELDRDADASVRRRGNLFELSCQTGQRERGGESDSNKQMFHLRQRANWELRFQQSPNKRELRELMLYVNHSIGFRANIRVNKGSEGIKTRNETGNLFYEFTINVDEVFCREGYVNAEALLAYLENVGATLTQALTMADLVRIEVHGPAAELAKLKEPLAHLKPAWFELHS